MNFEQLSIKLNNFGSNIISPNFLESVERWSKYQGEKLYVANISIEDKGTFIITNEYPKIIWGEKGDFTFSTTETELSKTIYDVSLINNSNRCTEHNNIVIISERNPEEDKPRNLFIYSVASDDNGTLYHPTFCKLTKDFQSQAYKPYFSLLHNFCGVYILMPYSQNTDRFFNYTAIFSDLEVLDTCFTITAKTIKVAKRGPNKHAK